MPSSRVPGTKEISLISSNVSPWAAKARAFAKGRDYVIPEDVTGMTECVFAHRLMLSSKARLNEYTPQAVVAQVLEQTCPPEMTEQQA